MRTLIIEQTVYNYSDLLLLENVGLKEKVISKFIEQLDYDWYREIYEDFTQIALERGFKVDKCYFSGFYSQGDGAMFEGSVIDFSKFVENKWVKKLIQNGSIFLEARFNHFGYYYNEKSYNYVFNAYDTVDHYNIDCYLYDVVQDEIKTSYESLCKELYQMLEKEYDYLTSEKYIMEEIKENNYEFDQNGNQIF